MYMCQEGFINLFTAVMEQAYKDSNLVDYKLSKGLKVTDYDRKIQADARRYIAEKKAQFSNW